MGRRCLGLLALVALASAGASAPTASAATTKKKAPCVRAQIGGKRVCLRIGARCDRAKRVAYLAVGLDCVMRRGKRVLAKATPAAVRQGRYIALPPSGEPTLAQALAAFDATVADLPGVRTVPGAVGDSTSGTAALTWLYDERDELTSEQRAVLDQVITPTADSQVVNVDADGNVTDAPIPTPQVRARERGPLRARAAQAVDRYTQIVREAIPRMQAHGVVVRHPVLVSNQPKDTGTAQANTWPGWLAPPNLEDGSAPPPAGNASEHACIVNVYPKAQGVSLAYMRQILVHELTHCAQDEFFTSIGEMGLVPRWVSDGTAEFVAYTISQEWNGSVTATGWWPVWLRTPQAGLFSRSYDAVGFFSLIAQQGANVFSLLGPLSKAGNSGVAYRIAEQAAGSTLASNWGTTLAMNQPLGPNWILNGPGAPRLPVPSKTIANDTEWVSQSLAKGADIVNLNLQADILHLITTAAAAPKGVLRDSAGTEHQLNEATKFCLRPNGCKCPDKPDPGYPKLPRGQAYLGYANPESSTGLTVVGEKLDCKKEDEPGAPEPGGAGTGGKGGPGGLVVHALAEGLPEIGRITTGKCTFTGGGFRATGSGSGYRFSMQIAGARGPGQYTIPNNDSGTYVKLTKGVTTFSTIGRNTTVLGVTGQRDAGLAVISKVRVKQRKGKKVQTVTRTRLVVGIDDLVTGGHPGVGLIPSSTGLLC